MRKSLFVATGFLLFVFFSAQTVSAEKQFTFECPPRGDYSYGQELKDGWRIWIQQGDKARVSRWTDGTAHPMPSIFNREGPMTEVSCTQWGGYPHMSAHKRVPGKLRCFFERFGAPRLHCEEMK